jgi:hypothetical protein
MKLLRPRIEHIPAYVSALRQGWSPDNLRPEVAQEQIGTIEKDASSFVSNLDDPTAKAEPVTLPDGSKVPRLSQFFQRPKPSVWSMSKLQPAPTTQHQYGSSKRQAAR